MLKTLVALFAGSSNNARLTQEKTDSHAGSEDIMDTTIILDNEQKAILLKSLEKFSQLALGQTGPEFEAAKKLYSNIAKAKGSTINVSGLSQ